MMFYGRSDNVIALLAVGEGGSFDSEIVRFCAAGGERDFGGPAAQNLRATDSGIFRATLLDGLGVEGTGMPNLFAK
jgi:hypothetical protein